LFRIASLGLFMTQMYMAIKYFKGKELSFALGLSVWSSLIPSAMAFNLARQVDADLLGWMSMSSIGAGLCLLSVIGLVILNKIEAADIREEEERPIVGEEYTMMRRLILLLGLAIICFFEANSYSTNAMFEVGMYKIPANGIHNVGKAIMLPLAGLLTDKMKKIPVMLAAIMMSFVGTLIFNFANEDTRSLFLYVSSFLVIFGYCIFEVSSWACVGRIAPSRSLGPALGLIHSGVHITMLFSYSASSAGFIAVLGLFIAFGLAVSAWKLDRSNGGKIDLKETGKSFGGVGIREQFTTANIRVN